MKVTVCVGGRFHAFNLAYELEKRGYLQRLITSYPVFEVKKYGIPDSKVESLIMKELLARGWSHLPAFIRHIYNPQFFIHEIFDKQACKKVIPTDIFVGWSSMSLYSMRRAKQLGAITILERGSSHMLTQQKLLEEEYERWGLTFKKTHPKIIEKELQEYEEADYIELPSTFAVNSFLRHGIPDKKIIKGLLRGVNLQKFKPVPKEDDVFRVVYAGAISLQKGIPYLLQAFKELNLKNAELLLIGRPLDELKPFLKKYKGHYKWVGIIPQPELYKYYSQGSVYVMPSIQEGLAMVQVQAMACGLPLICTTNTGGEDLIDDGKEGFIIPIRDVEALKQKILFLYDNKDVCKEMGRRAMEKTQSGFGWDVYGDHLIEIYKEILRQRGRLS